MDAKTSLLKWLAPMGQMIATGEEFSCLAAYKVGKYGSLAGGLDEISARAIGNKVESQYVRATLPFLPMHRDGESARHVWVSDFTQDAGFVLPKEQAMQHRLMWVAMLITLLRGRDPLIVPLPENFTR